MVRTITSYDALDRTLTSFDWSVVVFHLSKTDTAAFEGWIVARNLCVLDPRVL